MPKIIRVNLKTHQINTESISKEHPLNLFGGRSLTSKIVCDEVPPKIDPLNSENKLIFANGLLGGTLAPCSGRISIGAKSPLTNGIKESNVGGRTPALLSHQDIRAIILEEHAKEWSYLLCHDSKIELIMDKSLVGMNNYALNKHFQEKYGDRIGLFSIGIAGERLYKAASIASTDLEGYPSRHAGRGGLGAVMGSKKVKAIVVIPAKANLISYSNKEAFKSAAKEWGSTLYKSKRNFSKFGTLIGLTFMNTMHGLPTQNFRRGAFEDVDKISAEAVFDFIQTNHGKTGIPCSPGCVIQCSNLVCDSNGKHLTSSLEYETVALNGSNLLINNIEHLSKIDHICDDYGLDTIEIGNAFGVYMETGKIKWGDSISVIEILEKLELKDPDSIVIANGAVAVGEKYNITRVAQVKGQGISGYDPRTFKGMGVTYLTSPMGADHTAGAAIAGRKPYPQKEYGELHSGDHKVELSQGLQIFTMLLDAMGQCYFVGPTFETVPILVKLLNAKYGWELETTDLISMGKEWLLMEEKYNITAGLKKTERLPSFMETEKLEEIDTRIWDIPQPEIDRFWDDLVVEKE
ncbi:Tungsten-containing formaldehyde ferredoxin oxidoreductase [Candidatus Lokiarchaeum ossiferum]|uniref:Tungsten-containing formaldehyde ferredoxin oxidoreductase n=1 Tax=Candidatus Lokiarchaeum ossiferum TaxID=2951803 RepID=A0ABY6HMA5_9ARCH|nr:Tungsten-containing formaldehyde ferredoxin oxidoreductase [Candidatus Lokiarchaeum sp. B-35]